MSNKSDLSKSELKIARILDELLDAAIKGEFNQVLDLARMIHTIAVADQKKLKK